MDIVMWVEDPMTDGMVEIEQEVVSREFESMRPLAEVQDDSQSDEDESDDEDQIGINASSFEHSYASASEESVYDFEGHVQNCLVSIGDKSERKKKMLRQVFGELQTSQQWSGDLLDEGSDNSSLESLSDESDEEDGAEENGGEQLMPTDELMDIDDGRTERRLGSKGERQNNMVPLHELQQACKTKCIKVQMFEEIGVHRTVWRGKTLKQQEKWIFDQLRGPVLRAGTIGRVQMSIGIEAVCHTCWMRAMAVTRTRFYAIKLKVEAGFTEPTPSNYVKKGALRPKTELAIQWMDDHFTRHCDIMPDSRSRRLPVAETKQTVYAMYDAEMKGGREETVKFKHFRRVWRKNFKNVVTVKRSRFSQCTRCAKILLATAKAITEASRQQVQRRKAKHLKIAADERTKYQKHIRKAVRYAVLREGTSCMSISIDGMDQAKTDIPHMKRKPKSVQNNLTCPTHVTGVKVHGHGTFAYIDYTQFGKGANLCCTVLIDVLQRVLAGQATLPDVLYLQFDNARENKNKYLLGLCCLLVEKQVFKKIKIGFMVVGHTHCDIDQYFSRLSVRLGKGVKNGNVYTGDHLITAINTAVAEPNNAIGIVLNAAFDIKAWLDDGKHIEHIEDHSFPRCFRIKLENGKADIRTKRNSTDLEWLKAVSDQDLTLLKSHPAFEEIRQIKPNYAKLCLESEVGRQGLKQSMEAYYDFMDEEDVSWWNAFLAKVEAEDGRPPEYAPFPLAQVFGKFLGEGEQIERRMSVEMPPEVLSDDEVESDPEDYRLVIGSRKRRFTYRKCPEDAVELIYKKNDLVLVDDMEYEEWPLVGEVYEMNADEVKVLWYKGTKTGKWDVFYQSATGGRRSKKEDQVPVVQTYARSDVWSDGFDLSKKSRKLPRCVHEAMKIYKRKSNQ